MPRARSLTIAEVARRLGVSVDAVRDYEARGILEADRTPGGHRRFRPEVVEAFEQRRAGSAPAAARPVKRIRERREPRETRETRRAPQRPAKRRPSSHDWGRSPDLEMVIEEFPDDEDFLDGDDTEDSEPEVPEVPEWERRVKNARADVQVKHAHRELRQLEEEDEARERERRRREDRERAAAAEEERIRHLKAYGRQYVITAQVPPDVRAQVVEDLEGWVSGRTVPGDLSEEEQRELVRQRVDRGLRPWRQQLERQRARDRDQEQRARLIQSGTTHAMIGTFGWDFDDAEEARADVARRLRREVGSDWTDADVQELVDEVLSEWEEDEGDEGDEDEDD